MRIIILMAVLLMLAGSAPVEAYTPETLYSGDGDSGAISNTTTETLFDTVAPLAADSVPDGAQYRLSGTVRAGTNPGFQSTSITFRARFGPASAPLSGPTIGSSGLIPMGAGLVNKSFSFKALVKFRAIGSAGTLRGVFDHLSHMSSLALNYSGSSRTGSDVSAPTNVDSVLGFSAQWAAAHANNTATLEQLVLERLWAD